MGIIVNGNGQENQMHHINLIKTTVLSINLNLKFTKLNFNFTYLTAELFFSHIITIINPFAGQLPSSINPGLSLTPRL